MLTPTERLYRSMALSAVAVFLWLMVSVATGMKLEGQVVLGLGVLWLFTAWFIFMVWEAILAIQKVLRKPK